MPLTPQSNSQKQQKIEREVINMQSIKRRHKGKHKRGGQRSTPNRFAVRRVSLEYRVRRRRLSLELLSNPEEWA